MSARGISWRRITFLVALFLGLGLLAASAARGQQGTRGSKLRIGSSGTLSSSKPGQKETAALDTLQLFIKDETGLDDIIVPQKGWRELVANMAKGDLQLGVFQGYEFAWAEAEFPKLRPLALAVNVYRYPVGYVVVNKANAAKTFAGLKGESLSIPADDPRFLNLFIAHECAKSGKTPADFFGKITTPASIEDAIDDVVDNPKLATAVDRAALEAFKRSKPGRFGKLRPIAHSQPFPPPVVAYYDGTLDDATRTRFQQGLLGASKKEKGQTMLTLFHLTGFDAPPSDFDKVLNETRKHYPAPGK